MLDELGFDSINHRLLTRYYVAVSESKSPGTFRRFLDQDIQRYRRSISKAQFEAIYRSFAEDVKLIGRFQLTNNDLKNRLKHGKGIISGVKGVDNSNHVAFFKDVQKSNVELQLHWVDVSQSRFERAVIHTAQLYLRSLELLWLFTLHYHRNRVEEYREIWVEQSLSCKKRMRDWGSKRNTRFRQISLNDGGDIVRLPTIGSAWASESPVREADDRK